MSFETAFLDGYKKHTKHFDGWCRKASTILGDVTQCGILEVDSSGHGLIVANRPDFAEEYLAKEAYLLDTHFTYSSDIESNKIKAFHTRDEYEKLHLSKDSMFEKRFGLHCGFVFQEKINENINRIYWFASSDFSIYENIAGNSLVGKLIQCFAEDSKDIINYFREHKWDIASRKEKYFVTNKISELCPREKLNKFLQSVGVLSKDKKIHRKEWIYLQLHIQGKSAKESAEIMQVTGYAVNEHFRRLQRKFNVNSKSKLIEKIGLNSIT